MLDFRLESLKSSFFDRPKVTRSIDRAARSVLSRFGSYVRTRARSSIRRRKRISAPGSPPSSHVGTLKEGILFAYDADTKSVVIGPMRLNRGMQGGPRLLEEGGETTMEFRTRDRKSIYRKATYRARPFMLPAFRIELSKLPSYLPGSVRE